MRVVRGEHHPVRHLGELDRLGEVARVVRLFDRLGAQPKVLAEVLRRELLQARRVVAGDRVGRVHRPLQRPGPGEARFDERDLQAGEPVEHALADQAHREPLDRHVQPDVLLQVVRRRATAPVAVARLAAHVAHRDEVRRRAGFVDRPVLPVAPLAFRVAAHHHLDEARVIGEPLDLLRGQVGRVEGHVDAPAQPRVAGEPLLGEPVVDRPADRRLVLGRAPERERERDQDGDVGVVLFEQLGAHQVEVTARGPAAGHRGVDPEAAVAPARVVGDPARPAPAGVLVGVPGAPPLGQPREDVARQEQRVHVGIEQERLRAAPLAGCGLRGDSHRHDSAALLTASAPAGNQRQ